MVDDLARDPFERACLDTEKNEQNRFGFEPDAFLALVVKRSVEAADIGPRLANPKCAGGACA